MCGICGELSWAAGDVEDATLLAMRDSMIHRGPDGAGLWLSSDRRAGLGHRRLAIIDLSDAGAQPMANEDDRLQLCFNGEIYNHADLRAELEARGHRFRSHTDCEVVLHGYEEWGEAVLERLDGMFAFVIHDGHDGSLFGARDRIGIKPFYYRHGDGRFLFASEIKALLEHPAVSAELDPTALLHYLTFIAVPPPRTMFRGIRKLAAGQKFRLTAAGELSIEDWWSPAGPPGAGRRSEDIHTRPEAAIPHIRDTLRGAIRKRMMADVPFGVFLSGGVDSSLNVALMSEIHSEPVRTYSVAPKDAPELDELKWARQVAERYGTNHHEVLIDEQDMLDYLPRMIHHQDEPIGDCVCVPLHYVARLLKDDGTTVVQVGEGSDEQLAGYWWFQNHHAFERRWWRGPLPGFVKSLGSRLALKLSDRIRLDPIEVTLMRRLAAGQEPFWGGAIAFQHRDLAAIRGPALQPDVLGETEEAADVVAREMAVFHSRRGRGPLIEMMEFHELRQRLPELLLMRVDKMTMGNSVEARVPFLDQALVEYTMNLSPDLKIRGGEGKWILKKAAEGLLPEEIIWRRKQGFGAPTTRWFRGRLGEMMMARLEGGLAQTGMLNVERIRTMLDDHRAERADHGFHLWVLLNVLLWFDHFVAGEAIS